MMDKQTLDWSDVNDAKANFDDLYVAADPRSYYRILYGLDYVIPDLAKGVFRNAVAALEALRGRRITVLDIGCSYGVNAALMRYPLDIDRLARRYRDLDQAGSSTDQLVAFDRNYFSSWPRHDVRVIGLDISEPAVRYARDVGLLDDGIAINLENEDLTPKQEQLLRDVDLVVSTGCVGYVSDVTFRKVLAAIEGRRPWVASFVLRMFPYDGIARCLQEVADLESEKLEGVTFVQRRFRSQDEARQVISALEERGVPTEGKEGDGLYHAEFFLSRPRTDMARVPLEAVANVTSGAYRKYGQRWRRMEDDKIRLSL
jgi:SAM-dependent methyltransferase